MTAILQQTKKGLLLTLAVVLSLVGFAQNVTVTGKVTDSKTGEGVPGVSVVGKGTTKGTTTGADGAYSLSVPSTVKQLIFSNVSFEKQTVTINGTTANVSLIGTTSKGDEVVVVGYGTSRKKDLTGAIASIKEKDFNRGVVTSPDQLIQGKAAGVQIIAASGAPNAGISVRIRGNSSVRAGNEPLYVVDGIQLSGASARPGSGSISGDLGGLPGGNPLSFLNPNDIASIDVLKDASATAIYGSRGSNGVVLITTKRGVTGAPKLEISSAFGTSKVSRTIDYATADQYRAGLKRYNLTSGDLGGNTDAFKAITQTGASQNYNVAMSGGTADARYRLSLGHTNQKGIIQKTDFVKYNADLNASFKFLESKKLGLDIRMLTNQNQENIAPIGNNSGFRGSLLGQALQWNPTRSLFKPNGDLDIDNGGDQINPLAMSRAYDDKTNINTVFAAITPSYKFNDDLEYKLLVSFNNSVGNRRQQLRSFINVDGIQNDGFGRVSNATVSSQQITHTLNYNKKLSNKVRLSALAGYEYNKINEKGSEISSKGFNSLTINYYDGMAFGSQGTRINSSYLNPESEIQSYFTRATLNISEKYLVTATMRVDGSNKFGANNKYGYFPSFSAAWNIDKEGFMANNNIFSSLKMRAGYGITGNQDFPAGSAITRYVASGPGAYEQPSFNNPDLKWQQDGQSNVGIDFGILNGRVTGTIDYFNKTTKNLLVTQVAAVPSPGTNIWRNVDGNIKNSGVEISINANIINKEDLSWNFGFNTTLQKNVVDGLSGPLLTGEINGQGLSGAFVQRMSNGQPLNAFFVRKFNGIASNGQADLTDDGAFFQFNGSGIPTTLLGINTDVTYKKWNFSAAMNGAFGHKIYNNTLNAVLPINNLGKRNVSNRSLTGAQEALSSPITTSDRYLEKGNFIRLANATVSYNVGTLGKVFKNVNVFLTGQNLFVITKFTGFDPEVNVDKNINGVPSFGIEYTPYPAVRTFIVGFSLGL